MKSFEEALSDGFKKITNITDPQLLKTLRSENILIDGEGYHSFIFGDSHEYELAVEPIGEGYLVSLYKNKIRITEPLPVLPLNAS